MHRICTLLVALTAVLGAVELPREAHTVAGKPLPVSAKNEITISARTDADVRTRELWYRRRDNGSWQAWQKHGLTFARDTPITWSPPEAHWQIYVRIEEVSGLKMAEPDSDTPASSEFIIDRSPPRVAVTFPGDGAELRGGASYEITWTVEDPHLHATPITISWARSADGETEVIAEHIANTGSFEWKTPLDMTANGRIEIKAADKAGNIGVATTGDIVIDAVAPSRNILGPEISATRDVNLAIRASDAGPAGLASVQLYASGDNGTTWQPGVTISEAPFDSMAWSAPTDGLFLLALVAKDEAGNTSQIPSGAPAGAFRLLIDSAEPVTLSSPIGIADPDVDPETPARRIYKPGDRVRVPFAIKDANIRADGVTVAFQAQEGARWQVIGENLAPEQPFTWTIPNLATTSAKIRVTATDVAGNQGEAVASETFAVDNQVETGSVDIDL